MLPYLVAEWLAPMTKGGRVHFNHILPGLIIIAIVCVVVCLLNNASKTGRKDIPDYDVINDVFLHLMSIEGTIVTGILLMIQEKNAILVKPIMVMALCLEVTMLVVVFILQLSTKQSLKIIACDMALNIVFSTLLSVIYIVFILIAYFAIIFVIVIPIFLIGKLFYRD